MKRLLSVLGVTSLMMLSVPLPMAHAAGPIIDLEPGENDVNASPAWNIFLNTGSIVGGLVPGDLENVSAVFRNQSSTKQGRLKYGYFYMNKIPSNSTDAFFDDVSMRFDNNSFESINNSLVNESVSTADISSDPYNYLVASKTVDLAPGEDEQFSWDVRYDASSTNPPPNGTGVVVAIGVFMLEIEDPIAPTIVDASGRANDSVTAPADTDCITYTHNYNSTTGEYLVTGTAKQSCEFTNGETYIEYAGQLSGALTELTPETVTIVDNPGWLNDSVTAPSTPNINYNLEYDQETGEYTLTATPATGYTLNCATDPCVVTGTLNVDPISVDSTLPFVNDEPGWLNDSVTAPTDTDDVEYSIAYNQVTGDWVLTMTTTSADKVFSDGSRTKQLTGSLNTDPIIIPMDNPTIVDEDGTENDSVTAPENTTDVEYELEYNQETGEYTLTGTTLIQDKVFSNGTKTMVITGTLDTTKKVTPGNVNIVDNVGFVNDMVTPPADTDSVSYSLTYDQKTGVWKLIATVKPGYVFPNGETVITTNGVLDTMVPASTPTPTTSTPKPTVTVTKTPAVTTSTPPTTTTSTIAQTTVNNTRKPALAKTGNNTQEIFKLSGLIITLGLGLFITGKIVTRKPKNEL